MPESAELPPDALPAATLFASLLTLFAASFDVSCHELVYLFHFQGVPLDGLEVPSLELAYLFQRQGVSSSLAAELEAEDVAELPLPREPLNSELPNPLPAELALVGSMLENLPLDDLLSEGLTNPAFIDSPVEPLLPELAYLFHFHEPLLDELEESPFELPYLFHFQEASSPLDCEPSFAGAACHDLSASLHVGVPAGFDMLGGGGTGGFGMPAPL